MRLPRRRNSGFTLIEILIALLVLMIGIVGVVALFPVAIRNTGKSVEDTTAANVAQSLTAAMTEAMRRPAGDSVTLAHDGTPLAGATGKFTFTLPPDTGVPVTYPADGTVFQLCQDLITKDSVDGIRVMDPSEPIDQYGWQFEVAKIVGEEGLYQYTFRVFRNFDPALVTPAGYAREDMVKEFSVLIAKGSY